MVQRRGHQHQAWTLMPLSMLSHQVVSTVKYFSLFRQPVTAVQVWRNLVVQEKLGPVSFADVCASLQELVAEEKLKTKWGYYFLPKAKPHTVDVRLRRHRLAQMKWKTTVSLIKFLSFVPGVKMLAMSGSLAVANTKPQSDLDIFVVATWGRIWTTRLFVLVAAELLGRRRKYWQGEAPDQLCLNHYITQSSLTISPAIQNQYTAVLYNNLVPLFGRGVFKNFQENNKGWLASFIATPKTIGLGNVLAKKIPQHNFLKRQLDSFLQEPIFDWLENMAERLQRYSVRQHLSAETPGRIILSHRELAFHPDTKVPTILEKFRKK